MNESKFTGGLLGLISTNIVTYLLILITLGIGTPWAICFRERWYAENTYINGKRLQFIGTGLELFGKYIIWLLLTIITLGIYGFWLTIKLKQWTVSKTVFAK